ncbi:uncharacterized protein LOC102457026 [Pelodiscus sinensis]|uniref:uncharacterized protein LOC102457026 n=1 Tax=Pelodiscus sinensis TaxID=13735 RepID=UPI003F6A7532
MTLQTPQHFQHGTDPAAKQYQALRPPAATPGTVPAGCPCGAAGGRRSAWNGGISSPRSRHSSCTTFPPTSTLCAAASGAVRPVPIGGIASSWSGGMTSSGSRTSACRRTPFWSSANGSSLLSGDRTPGGDPPTPSRSRHHHTLEARHTGEATALWETSSECGEQPSGPCSCRSDAVERRRSPVCVPECCSGVLRSCSRTRLCFAGTLRGTGSALVSACAQVSPAPHWLILSPPCSPPSQLRSPRPPPGQPSFLLASSPPPNLPRPAPLPPTPHPDLPQPAPLPPIPPPPALLPVHPPTSSRPVPPPRLPPPPIMCVRYFF